MRTVIIVVAVIGWLYIVGSGLAANLSERQLDVAAILETSVRGAVVGLALAVIVAVVLALKKTWRAARNLLSPPARR